MCRKRFMRWLLAVTIVGACLLTGTFLVLGSTGLLGGRDLGDRIREGMTRSEVEEVVFSYRDGEDGRPYRKAEFSYVPFGSVKIGEQWRWPDSSEKLIVVFDKDEKLTD